MAQVLNALRAHRVIGVDTKDIKQVTVTRLARTVEAKDDRARGGAGDRASRRPRRCRQYQSDLRPRRAGHASRRLQHRRDAGDRRRATSRATAASTSPSRSPTTTATPTQLRFTGSAIETVEVAVLTRNVERSDILKSSDVIVERRPRAEVGSDAAAREQRGRHADAPPDPRRPAAAGRRSRQTRSGAARPGRHRDLPDRRPLSHHARQGARQRHRRRRGQRAQPAVQAHGDRHRHRPRPGHDPDRHAAARCVVTDPDVARTPAPTAVAADTHSPVTSKPE